MLYRAPFQHNDIFLGMGINYPYNTVVEMKTASAPYILQKISTLWGTFFKCRYGFVIWQTLRYTTAFLPWSLSKVKAISKFWTQTLHLGGFSIAISSVCSQIDQQLYDFLRHMMDILTHWGRDRWTTFRRRHFRMHFLEWKCLNTD